MTPLALTGLAVYAFLLRSLHLFDANHYYIVSPDSNFFHWLAGRVMAGQGPPLDSTPEGLTIYSLHSGLAYPLAYIAKAASSIFGLSSPDALALVAKFLPPTLAVISMLVVYLIAAKIYDRRVGLISAFAWAIMVPPVLFGAAGYLDRDGLSMLLFMIGAFLFYLSGAWHIKVRGRDVGWLIAGAGALVMEALLYLEWGVAGPVLLLAVIVAYFVVRFLLEYLGRMETESDIRRRLSASIGKVNWRTFALIIGVNVVVAGLNFHQAASWWDIAISMVQSSATSPIAEGQGLSLGTLTVFHFFLIVIVAGLYVAFKKRSDRDIFFATWFMVLLILSIFTRRVLLYAVPAACLLAGVGLTLLWYWRGWGLLAQAVSSVLSQYFLRGRVVSPGGYWRARFRFPSLNSAAVAVLLGLMVIVSTSSAYFLASGGTMAPDREWQDALTYLREETPKDSVIMSQWSWGYWILDLGQRRPVVDNGFYGWEADRLRDVGLAYSMGDPAEAAQLMKKYGANYLVLSKLDLNVASTIMLWANVGAGQNYFPFDSLVVRSLDGEFESGGGLQVVYRSAPDSEVVILGLTQAESP